MNDDGWWMMNDEWRMMDDEWLMNDWVSHELRRMNDESRMINDEWWLSSSKCSTEKSHQFISKVSQKLDYCLSTHTHTNPIPTSLCNRKHWIGLLYKRKDWVPFQPRCAISKVSQKLEYCLSTHTLTHTHTHWTVSWHPSNFYDTFENQSWLIYEWWMTNDELDVVTSKKTKLIRSTSQQTEPFPIWTENSALRQ